MIKVEKSIVLHKPVEELFHFVTGPDNYTTWQAVVEQVIESDPRTTLELTEFVPNTKWAAIVVKGPVRNEVHMTFQSVEGGTKTTTCADGEPKGFFKLAEGMVSGHSEKSLGEDVQKLKELVEAN